MSLPEAEVAAIRRWCTVLAPACDQDRPHLEVATTNTHVTIIQVRPLPDGRPWRRPMARLRYVKYARMWSLYWADRHGRFHEHRLPPAADVQVLLDHLATQEDPVFFG